MSISTTEQKLNALRERLGSIPLEQIRLYSLGHELAKSIPAKRFALVTAIGQMDGQRVPHNTSILDPGVDAPSASYVASSNLFAKEYTCLLALQHALENSEDYRVAKEVVEPLHKELVATEAQAEAERIERQQKETALANAVKAAEAKALAEAKNHPSVIKAQKDLESFVSK